MSKNIFLLLLNYFFLTHFQCPATWSNRDESHNPRQSVDELIIKDEKKIEVEMEIRRQVDNLMREELDLLKAVRQILASVHHQLNPDL